MTNWTTVYLATADFMPYRTWLIRAEGVCAARLALAALLGIEYDFTNATPAGAMAHSAADIIDAV